MMLVMVMVGIDASAGNGASGDGVGDAGSHNSCDGDRAATCDANPGDEIRLKGYDERPSLNWYSEQRIQRFKGDPGRRLSDKPQQDCITEGQAGRWTIANCR